MEDRIERFGLSCTFNGKQFVRGHECVDLGLPSGTLWAKCNLGAKKETDFGKYFQFGQFKPYEETFNDYVPMELDTVGAIWHNGWKTPTQNQFRELIENTVGEWVKIDGVNGYKFINKNDKSKYMFFPAAGFASYGSMNNVGSSGYCWSSSLYTSDVIGAYSMRFNSSTVSWQSSNGRRNGFPLRGVLDKEFIFPTN